MRQRLAVACVQTRHKIIVIMPGGRICRLGCSFANCDNMSIVSLIATYATRKCQSQYQQHLELVNKFINFISSRGTCGKVKLWLAAGLVTKIYFMSGYVRVSVDGTARGV